MSVSEASTTAAPPSLARDWLTAIRHYLGGRRGLVVLGGAVVVAGLWFNWGWLVAAGVAPLLLSALPCVAMCALGFCMMGRAGGGSCSAEKGAPDAGAQAAPGATPRPNQLTPDLADPAASPRVAAAGQPSTVKE